MLAILFISLLIALVSAFICFSIAHRRQANVRFWALMGMFFGPVAIPFVLFSRPIH